MIVTTNVERDFYMNHIKKLPDAELELMKIIWANEPPISTNEIISNLGEENSWKPQTVLTLLMRLIDKGFLTSERKGKERIYSPAINEQDYLQYETGIFIGKFHQNSLVNLVNTLYNGKKLTERDMEQLADFLKDKGEKNHGKMD